MSRPSYSPEDDFLEEAVEFLPAHEGDLIYQLGQKIRDLSHKVTSLEHYKVLCERRIAELSPNHTLPLDLKASRLRRSDSYGPTPPLEEAKASLELGGGKIELQTRGTQLLDREKGLEEELERTKRALEASQSEANALTTELDDRNEQIAALISELKETKRQLTELEQVHKVSVSQSEANLQAQLHSLESALSQSKAEFSSLQSQKEFFQSAYNSAKQEAGAHEAAEFRAKGEIRELQKALQVLWDGASSAARNAQAQDEQYLAEIRAMQKTKSELELAVERERVKGKKELESCRDLLESQIKTLEGELETAQSQLKEAKETLSSLQNHVNTLEKDLVRSQSTLVPDTKFSQHAAGLVDEVQSLQLQQDRTLEELKALRMQLRVAAEETYQAETQLERLRKEANKQEEQLGTALDEQRRSKELLERILQLLPGSEMALELVQASAELAAAERTRARLVRSREAEEDIRQTEGEVDRARKRVQQLDRELQTVQHYRSGRTPDPRVSSYLSDSSKQRLASLRLSSKHLL